MNGALATRLERITKCGGIKGKEVAQLLSTTPETISRWRTGRTEPRQDGLIRLLEVEYLLEELSEFFEPKEARFWLFSPHRLLNGDTPVKCIQEGRADEVRAVIAQLRDGAYV